MESIHGLLKRLKIRAQDWVQLWVGPMEEPGEQCTVVFALIGTELASECVCGEGGGVVDAPPPPTIADSVTLKGTVS